MRYLDFTNPSSDSIRPRCALIERLVDMADDWEGALSYETLPTRVMPSRLRDQLAELADLVRAVRDVAQGAPADLALVERDRAIDKDLAVAFGCEGGETSVSDLEALVNLLDSAQCEARDGWGRWMLIAGAIVGAGVMRSGGAVNDLGLLAALADAADSLDAHDELERMGRAA